LPHEAHAPGTERGANGELFLPRESNAPAKGWRQLAQAISKTNPTAISRITSGPGEVTGKLRIAGGMRLIPSLLLKSDTAVQTSGQAPSYHSMPDRSLRPASDEPNRT